MLNHLYKNDKMTNKIDNHCRQDLVFPVIVMDKTLKGIRGVRLDNQ